MQISPGEVAHLTSPFPGGYSERHGTANSAIRFNRSRRDGGVLCRPVADVRQNGLRPFLASCGGNCAHAAFLLRPPSHDARAGHHERFDAVRFRLRSLRSNPRNSAQSDLQCAGSFGAGSTAGHIRARPGSRSIDKRSLKAGAALSSCFNISRYYQCSKSLLDSFFWPRFQGF
jgi:hypothetical protein